MDSPLATSTRVLARRRPMRQRPRERWLRVFGLVGAFVLHIIFLLSFVLGPAYEVKLPPEPKVEALHIRLIDAPEPPPPLPIRGTPPKNRGPRHQGHVSSNVAAVQPTSAQRDQQSSAPSTAAVAQASRASAASVTSQQVMPAALKPRPVAAPPAPVSVPKAAPAAQLQAIPRASEPPVVTMTTPTMRAPVPPRFQPEPVRPPQVEGNQSMPPPASLALPDVPAQAVQPVERPTIALTVSSPHAAATPSIAAVRAEAPATPPEPELQAIPLAAQPSPKVNLTMSVSVATPTVPRASVTVQAPAAEPAEPQLEPVPQSPLVKPDVAVHSPSLKVDAADKSSAAAVRPSIPRPELSPTPATADAATGATAAKAADAAHAVEAQAQSAAAEASPSAEKSSAEKSSTDKSSTDKSSSPTSNASPSRSDHDVSSAPNATPQGSDTATPGALDGVASAAEASGRDGRQRSTALGQGSTPSVAPAGNGAGAGRDAGSSVGTSASGTPSADKSGAVGSYVQVMPTGDTRIMNHATPNIGYKSTRFNRDWTPLDESSVDTALRHAVEKTTATHTFHLPRGIRVKCALSPLLPMALFSCGSGDPPPEPLADKVYDRMHLTPANPVVAPAPPSSTGLARPSIQLDNSADCAAARISGGPLPPGCVSMTLPVKMAQPGSASSSGSWVPASDQFH